MFSLLLADDLAGQADTFGGKIYLLFDDIFSQKKVFPRTVFRIVIGSSRLPLYDSYNLNLVVGAKVKERNRLMIH